MKKLLLFLCCAPFLLAATCEDDDDILTIPCTTGVVNGLNVAVTNSATGAVLTSGVTVVAVEGDNSINVPILPGSNPAIFSGVPENPGTYIVTVSKSGYVTYVSEPITVTANSCHVITQNIAVALMPD